MVPNRNCAPKTNRFMSCKPLWLAGLAYLVDLHDHVNLLNKRLQGKDQLVSDMYLEMKTYCTLFSLYESQLTNCECDHFPTLFERTTSDPKAKIKSRKNICNKQQI